MKSWNNTPAHYGWVAQWLHWVVAAGVIALIALGWWMVGLDYYNPWYHRAPELHKSIGMVVLVLAVLRIAWTAVNPPPALQTDLSRWERLSARVTHHLLYAMTVLIPLTGYLISTALGDGVDMFGWLEVPALLPADKGRESQAGAIHAWLAYGTAALVAAHTAAALKHQFLDGRGTLRRMAGPVPRPRSTPPHPKEKTLR